MANKLTEDPRIDPRIKAIFGELELSSGQDVESREQLLAAANTEEAIQQREMLKAFLDMSDSEDVAPSKGLSIRTETVASQPDGNTINIQYIRPDSDEVLPCIYSIK